MISKMPNSRKNLSIIITAYGSGRYLSNCLDSLRAKIPDHIDREIIIVDNEGAGSLASFEDEKAGIRVIAAPKNNGFGAGNNLGNTQAAGEIILFLNPDVELISENIEHVLEQFKKDPRIGIVGSKLTLPDGGVQNWSCGREMSLIQLTRNNLKLFNSRQPWHNKENTKVDWVSGTALFIRKELFDKINGFDEKFFMYFEDMDLCARARKQGYQVIYFPSFSILHFGGKSYLDKQKQKSDYYNSLEHYFHKHHGPIKGNVIKLLRKILLRKYV
jgi:GT2 family glycosyltransferase